jgi:hypothetical protein
MLATSLHRSAASKQHPSNIQQHPATSGSIQQHPVNTFSKDDAGCCWMMLDVDEIVLNIVGILLGCWWDVSKMLLGCC